MARDVVTRPGNGSVLRGLPVAGAALVIVGILVLVAGCTTVPSTQPQENASPSGTGAQASAIAGTQDLVLDAADLQQLGMVADMDAQDLEQLGIVGGTNCWTDDAYSNVVDSSVGQYTVCAYVIPALNNTQVIIQLQGFANQEALNGSYQYDSSHLYSAQGLMSENAFGDQSRFRVNSEADYGGQFNPPGVTFYHLWFTKGLYLVHITSSGSADAKQYIADIGHTILSKFG